MAIAVVTIIVVRVHDLNNNNATPIEAIIEVPQWEKPQETHKEPVIEVPVEKEEEPEEEETSATSEVIAEEVVEEEIVELFDPNVGYQKIDDFYTELAEVQAEEYAQYELEQAQASGFKTKGNLIIVSSSCREYRDEAGNLWRETIEVYRDLDWNLYEFPETILIESAPAPAPVVVAEVVEPAQATAQDTTPAQDTDAQVAPSPEQTIETPAEDATDDSAASNTQQGVVEEYTDAEGNTFNIIW